MELREHQLNQLVFHWENPKSLNRSEPGTGKTPTFCSLAQLVIEVENKQVVLLNPVSLSFKNKQEMMLWAGLTDEEVVIVKGTPEKRKKLYNDPKVKVFISSFETFCKEWELYPSEIGLVIVDESHLAFSNHESGRSQEFYRAARRVKRVLFCTGTPINGRYSSIYPIAAICAPNYYGNIRQFNNIHAVIDDKYGGIVGWKNPEPIAKLLNSVSVGITTKEAFKDSPDNIIITEKCELDAKQMKAYSEMENDAMAELDDKYLEAQNQGVQALRCRQLLSCPETFELKIPTIGKDAVLKTHLENAKIAKERVLIFSVFVEEQKRIVQICKDMGLRVGLINGTVSGDDRGKISERFAAHKLDVVVGSPQTMSTGFNFEFVNEIIFVSCSYEDSTFEQGCARGNRGTRKTPLRVYVLQYDVRVEKRIWEIISRKQKEKKEVFSSMSQTPKNLCDITVEGADDPAYERLGRATSINNRTLTDGIFESIPFFVFTMLTVVSFINFLS